MSYEAWGEPDEGMDVEPLLDAGWWEPEKAGAVLGAIQALVEDPVYESGKKENGISARFLMRLTVLQYEAGFEVPQPMYDEAVAALRSPPTTSGPTS